MALIQAAISPEKILIVEDDADLAQRTPYYLQGKYYQKQTTISGTDTVILITKQAPNVIFLGYKSPDLDGLDVCQCQQILRSYKVQSLC
jgi:DNA-binding response OmpR family regulator